MRRTFVVPEFSTSAYDGTLFSDLEIVDDRNPVIIRNSPIPPLIRIIALAKPRKSHAMWPAHKLDGSPDYRFSPVYIGGGQPLIAFSKLLTCLENARMIGDLFEHPSRSGFPVMLMDWAITSGVMQAAVLTSTPGWTRPLYFKDGFDAFSEALDRLIELKAQILAGTAAAEMRSSS